MCQKPSQAAKHEADQELKDLVHSKNSSKTIRSSAGHYWRIMDEILQGRRQNSLSPKELAILKDLSKVEGWVIGDLHNGNLSPVRLETFNNKGSGKIEYALVDYDDPAPRGPLIMDLIHHIIAAKAVGMPSSTKLQKRDIFISYLVGLAGKSFLIPPRIESILNMDPREFRSLEIDKAKKFAKKDGVSLNKKSILLPAEERLYVQKIMQDSLGSAYDVIDVGGREKETGGSAGALRYVALVREKSSGDIFLFEAKEEAVSAVSEYRLQPEYSYKDRLKHFVFKNREADPRFQEIVVEKEGRPVKMTLRPKPLYFFDYANDGRKNSAFMEFRELTLFNATWLGLKQLKDDGINARILFDKMSEHNFDAVYDMIKKLTYELNAFYEENSG